MKNIIIISCLLILFSVVGAAEKDRISIMDVQDEDKLFDKRTVGKITDFIFSKFDSAMQYWMVPKSSRDEMLLLAAEETMQDSRKECVDEKCQLSMASKLAAAYLINTKIKKLYAGTCQITISKFDVEKTAGVGTWEEKFNCTEKGLYQAIDSFYFGSSSKEGTAFQKGKIGKLEDEWTPEMAGRGEVGVIHFESDPEGANIYFDKELLGKTPKFKSKSLPTGRHQIKVEKEGYYTEVITKDLKKGERVPVKLFPGIKITSSPEGAVVRLNGRLLCDSTPCEKVIDEGNVELTFEKDMYKPMKQFFNIKRGNDINIKLDPNFGWLEVKSDYEGIEITLDDNVIGNTPIEKRMESTGPHIIGAKHKCYHTTGENIEIKLLKTTTVKVDAQPKMAAIDVSAKDSDGNDLEENVFVDGQIVGTSPGTFPVSICSREVVVKAKTGEFKQNLKLQEKKVSTVNALFKSQTVAHPAKVGGQISSDGNWSKKSPKEMNWSDAKAYCEKLKEDGYSDWRLPTISELRTLIKNCPATETSGACKVNNNCLSKNLCWSGACSGTSGASDGRYSKLGDTGWFWSSSELSEHTGYAWHVYFKNGNVFNSSGEHFKYGVRCVRGNIEIQDKKVSSVDALFKSQTVAQSAKVGGQISSDGSWSKKSPKQMSWHDAKAYCEKLKEDGYSDWRLPTISELRTLIQNCPVTETGGACKVTNKCLFRDKCRTSVCGGCSGSSDGRYSKLGDTGWFWSSSELSDSPDHAWHVHFHYGNVANSYQYYPSANHVRCVR